MRSHDELDDLEIVIEERSGLRPFILGALVGAGAALLLAPRTGRDMQRELARVLMGLRAGGVGGAAGSLTGWTGGARGRVTGRVEEARQAVDDGVGRVRGAVEEGRMAARQARAELRRRLDEAREMYRSGQAGTAPVRHPLAPAPVPSGADGGVTITRVATERDPGDLAG